MNLGVEGVGLYGGTKHIITTALGQILTREAKIMSEEKTIGVFLIENKEVLYLFIGFAFTIIGTIIAWVLNFITTSHQLKRRKEEKEREREYQLLKDVYLKAYLNISKNVMVISLIAPQEPQFAKQLDSHQKLPNVEDMD